ncbi:MAG: S9 family peptidase [Steroidobacteraceae bacterium]
MAARAPCGTWRSPLSAADLARSAISLDDLQVAGGAPYWIESRPTEGGRYVIVTLARPGAGEPPLLAGISERTPADFNARTRVHEYGGRPYTAAHDGTLFFSHFPDQRLYAQRPDAAPVALTPPGLRYADFALDPQGTRLYCVREDHTAGSAPRNAIVALEIAVPGAPGAAAPPSTGAGTLLFGGSDFVAYPRVSPDGRHLAWIAWNHPDMPWDATTLHVADLAPEGLEGIAQIAGGPGESVLEPRWDADGTLYFVSDRSGWWNLCRFRNGRVEPVLALEAEIGGPLWTLGESSYALTGDGRAVVRCTRNAEDRLGIVALGQSAPVEFLDLPFVAFSNIQMLDRTSAIAIAASATAEPAVVAIGLASGAYQVLRAPGALELDAACVSRGEPIAYASLGGETAHAFYYPPTNSEFLPLEGEKPPLVVKVHGGPTAHSAPQLNLGTQFWTSRGCAVLDVNYGGSSGYGRAYRERLNGNWGIVDVADVVAGVKHLVSAGRVDPARTAIRGGSAGGFTVLAALAFHDVFRAGADYFGVSDLEALAHDTHKFESRYLDRLVAPLPAGKAVYEARAPLHHLESFHAPLIVFQGAEDAVVPPSQSRAIVQALERKGVPVVYLELAGEQHGFRRAESIVSTLEAELAFYGRIFGFTPATG